MKKAIIISATNFLIGIVANAQVAAVVVSPEILSDKNSSPEIMSLVRAAKKNVAKVNDYDALGSTKESFAADFGNIPVDQWRLINNYEVASFMQDGQFKCAYYDFNSELVVTTTEAKFSDLPVSAQDHISKKYDAYSIKDVLFYDDNEANEIDLVLNGEELLDKDSYFVELNKGNETVVLHVDLNGDVSLFKKISG
jgi:hypothetical protein